MSDIDKYEDPEDRPARQATRSTTAPADADTRFKLSGRDRILVVDILQAFTNWVKNGQ